MKADNEDIEDRIFQGFQAPTNIPWQVRLRMPYLTLPFIALCGGTILDKNTILTAAHCVVNAIDNIPSFLVISGRHTQYPGQTVRVDEVYVHPQYEHVYEQRILNDIAVLKLKTPLNIEEGVVQPACLPGSSFAPINGEIVATSGWGLTQQTNDIPPEALQVQQD